jgi:aubergine-like protein
VSNIIRQINIKLGGESYKVELPKEVPANTMFVGIDVCHFGRDSIVGFYSNANTTLARCYCDTAPQKKGKEIISILVPFYKKALDTYFKDHNKLPEYILIFRDGVGNRQRRQIISLELPQVLEAIKSYKAGYNPNITLVIANKRIHQRFFKEHLGTISNPVPGTIVDDFVTEKNIVNFFLISATSRVGTVRPSNYYIAYNDKKSITAEVIQKVAFATACMYYNGGGPVKVPAHIHLADKKANLMSILNGASNEKLILSQSFI